MNKNDAKAIIINTFESAFDKGNFTEFISNLLKKYDRNKAIIPQNLNSGIPKKYEDFIDSWETIGQYKCPDPDDSIIDILIVKLKKEPSLYYARSKQRNFISGYLKGELETSTGRKDAVLVAFVSPNNEDWRFSLVKMDYRFVETSAGKMKVKEEFTPTKRWSFLVGKNEKSHTAQSRFVPILENDNLKITIEILDKAFDVEVVAEEFFEKYRNLFIKTKSKLDEIIGLNKEIKTEFETKNINTVDFAKKLLGQIAFLYFLQKKGWFGVEKEKSWGSGPKDFIRRLFDKDFGNYNNFYKDILEPLFYEALRTDRTNKDNYYNKFNCKIPFLNGGLFDPMNDFNWVEYHLPLPNDLFSNDHLTKEGDEGDGILDVFDRYNFTVNEEEPLEKEVALDPELLGKIYEKLNAIRPDNFNEYLKVLNLNKNEEETKFNKEHGVYYTPKEIVRYMCQESLINYLETQLKDKVDVERFVKHADIVLNKEEITDDKGGSTLIQTDNIYKTISTHAEEIDKMLADIKVVDPAVGSGAFPVGMMHEITKLRQLLSIYLDKNVKTYELKRHCIENSLYGIDIDPGAVEICRLRFWLSMIVDENDFCDIKPLPNLDYKVVCGDSLFGVKYEIQNQEILDKIQKLKSSFFNETDPSNKCKYKRQIDELINEITNGHTQFDFQLYFYEVFSNNGGFDIVIANPPYVRHEKIKDLKSQLENQYTNFYNSISDLYTYFYKKSFNILRNNGVSAFISSNKWMRAKYGLNLRKFLNKNTTVIKIVDFSGYSVFKQTVDTNIILFQKVNPDIDHTVYFVNVKSEVEDVIRYIDSNTKNIQQNNLSENAWTLSEENVLVLKDKIEKVGKPFRNWDGIKIYRGIVTGYNEAFIINTETKNKILANCKTCEEKQRTTEIIKPVLMGRNVNKWYYKWAELWLIKIEMGWTNKYRGKEDSEEFFKKTFPTIYQYLKSFEKGKGKGKGLLDRDDKGDYWWELRACVYYLEFEKEKIVWQEMSDVPSFAFDEKHFYNVQTVYIATGLNLKYILGILNSRLSYFYLTKIACSLSEGANRWTKQYVERIPIPPITLENKNTVQKIECFVNEIISLTQSSDYKTNKDQQAEVKNLEKQIDELVYTLYKLFGDDIKVIDEETKNNFEYS